MTDHTRKKIADSKLIAWLDERLRVKDYLVKAMDTPVKPWSRKWYYCFGGLTLTMFLLLVITGILLFQHYSPTTAGAAKSVAFIMGSVWMGWLIRGIHHWAANFMMILVVAHMLRVFLTGAYKKPREMNWVIGVILLLGTGTFFLTGYIMPWDQRGYELASAVYGSLKSLPLVGNWMAGLISSSTTLGNEALGFFYTLHTVVLPLTLFALLLFHFVMIRRQHIADPL